MAKKKGDALLQFPVSYSNVSIGDKTVRVGVTVSRGNLTSAQADKTLCGKRLTGKLLARSSGGSDQASLPAIESDYELSGVFDVKGISLTVRRISFGLTFNREDISVETIADFAKREGEITIEDAKDLPKEEADDDEEE